ncbi:MAG: hypothetical protein B1H04_06770, partial [Planctomycetales bacterium 4484_123]
LAAAGSGAGAPAAETATASRPAGKVLRPAKGLRIDLAARKVIIDAAVSERQELLEFVLCTRGTKDYESLLVTDVKPSMLHAALLALKLTPGKPGRWSTPAGKEPVFLPPAGAGLEIAVRWKDKNGRRREVPVTEWLLAAGTKKKPKPIRWVFVGSGLLADGSYWADVEGHHISLANFASSVIDVPFKSSDKNAFLEFAPNAALVPPKGTPVEVVISPVKGAENAPDARVTFVVDALGRIEMDGRPIAPEEIAAAVKGFLARHSRGSAEIKIDPRALAYDRDRLESILADAGVREVRVETRRPEEAPLPRTAAQAARALAWWRKQFATAGEQLVGPAEDAARVLRHIERRRKELQDLLELWGDYAARLGELLKKHQASGKRPGQ